MSIGFFPSSDLAVKAPKPLVSRCGICGLYKGCNSPKMKMTGDGKKKILVVAEAPGKNEDEQGEQLIGKAGQHLRNTLKKFDVDLDRDCWKTNSVICRPRDNETPSNDQIESCRPNLNKVIKELNPNVIILLGAVAVKSLIGQIWKNENPGPLNQWVGWKIPSIELNAWICPTYHPSYLKRVNDNVLQLWFERHLEEAIQLDEKPYPDELPDYEKQVEVIMEPTRAASILEKMRLKGGRISFDYETNMQKPDSKDAKIFSCSVCWEGKKTIAFPWVGDVVGGMGQLLKDGNVRKIGWNIKFEQRWTKKEFGHGVANWVYDGMLGSHVLDNREGITSAKFQAFVLLGIGDYSSNISPYLQEKCGNVANKIHELDLRELLLYNGIDSLVEFRIAEIQAAQLGIAL